MMHRILVTGGSGWISFDYRLVFTDYRLSTMTASRRGWGILNQEAWRQGSPRGGGQMMMMMGVMMIWMIRLNSNWMFSSRAEMQEKNKSSGWMTRRRKYGSLNSSQVERDANEKSKRVYNPDLGNPGRLALRCVWVSGWAWKNQKGSWVNSIDEQTWQACISNEKIIIKVEANLKWELLLWLSGFDWKFNEIKKMQRSPLQSGLVGKLRSQLLLGSSLHARFLECSCKLKYQMVFLFSPFCAFFCRISFWIKKFKF